MSEDQSDLKSLALQQTQIGMLAMIWSNVTTNEFMQVGAAIAGVCWLVSGAIGLIRK